MTPRPRFASLALLLAAGCSAERGPGSPRQTQAPSSAVQRGPDALALRVPRGGGQARIVAYANVDSVLWTASDPSPALDRVLAFDDEAGLIAFVDGRGYPGRIDLRLGTVENASRAKLFSLASADASVIYGIGSDGAVVRLTLSGDWVFKPPRPARNVFPQRDGSLIVLSGRSQRSELWRLRPPDTKVSEADTLPPVARAVGTQLGDRLYFVSASSPPSLLGVRTRTLTEGSPIPLRHNALAVVATPSGDRLYVASDSSHTLSVIDRYRDRVVNTIDLPGQPQDLRVDGLGRYLLIRAGRDSMWVLAIGTDRLVGEVRTTWRSDLPVVAADGSIMVIDGKSVLMVDGETLRVLRRVDGGASDFWFPFLWTGFRPRESSLDQPVQFAADSLDTTHVPAPAVPETTAATRPAPPADSSMGRGFFVSFAALLSEPRARNLASLIRIDNQNARVVPTSTAGTTIYRVLLGPYASREEADRVGRQSSRSYWVFEGTP